MNGRLGGWDRSRDPLVCFLVLAAVIASVLLSACGSDSRPKAEGDRPPVVVQVVTAVASELPRTLAAVGSLQGIGARVTV